MEKDLIMTSSSTHPKLSPNKTDFRLPLYSFTHWSVAFNAF